MKGVLSLTWCDHMCACMSSVPAAGCLCQKTLGKQQGVIKAARWLINRKSWAWDLPIPASTSPSAHQTHTYPTANTKSQRAVDWSEDGDRGSPLQMQGCNCISCPVGRGWAWVALKWTQSGGHIEPLAALQPSASLLRRISYAAFLQQLTKLWGVNGSSQLLVLCLRMSPTCGGRATECTAEPWRAFTLNLVQCL